MVLVVIEIHQNQLMNKKILINDRGGTADPRRVYPINGAGKKVLSIGKNEIRSLPHTIHKNQLQI